jgi:wyosine [tRNA(Phe)-imidazoG37] synthetase (radical SAM superfamily)
MLNVSSIIFGPVNSRRLGRSLGVNLIPHKTCNLNCVYCECGSTTDLTSERKNYFDPNKVLEEIEQAVTKDGHIDFITFAGNGEPSLYKDIKKITHGIKTKFPNIKLAIITNATLFTNKDVFDAFLEADVLLPSIDSVLEAGFKKMNRPLESLSLKEMLEALLKFKKVYKGELWAEIFICHGINDTDAELAALKDYMSKLKPDRIQLNSLDRPSAEAWVQKTSVDQLKKVMEVFKNISKVEIISRY